MMIQSSSSSSFSSSRLLVVSHEERDDGDFDAAVVILGSKRGFRFEPFFVLLLPTAVIQRGHVEGLRDRLAAVIRLRVRTKTRVENVVDVSNSLGYRNRLATNTKLRTFFFTIKPRSN